MSSEWKQKAWPVVVVVDLLTFILNLISRKRKTENTENLAIVADLRAASFLFGFILYFRINSCGENLINWSMEK